MNALTSSFRALRVTAGKIGPAASTVDKPLRKRGDLAIEKHIARIRNAGAGGSSAIKSPTIPSRQKFTTSTTAKAKEVVLAKSERKFTPKLTPTNPSAVVNSLPAETRSIARPLTKEAQPLKSALKHGGCEAGAAVKKSVRFVGTGEYTLGEIFFFELSGSECRGGDRPSGVYENCHPHEPSRLVVSGYKGGVGASNRAGYRKYHGKYVTDHSVEGIFGADGDIDRTKDNLHYTLEYRRHFRKTGCKKCLEMRNSGTLLLVDQLDFDVSLNAHGETTKADHLECLSTQKAFWDAFICSECEIYWDCWTEIFGQMGGS